MKCSAPFHQILVASSLSVSTLGGGALAQANNLPPVVPPQIAAETHQLGLAGPCAPTGIPTFHGVEGPEGAIRAWVEFDDGTGPALYGGGYFGFGKLTGSGWELLDDQEWIICLAVFDDGNGAALYAGGAFGLASGIPSRLARWDGAAWVPLAPGITQDTWFVSSMVVFDDGSGPALHVGGYFEEAGGVAAQSLARWDGTTWESVGGGIAGDVRSMTVFDDGVGPALYVGGVFTTAGGTSMNNIAKWDGSSWTALGFGLTGAVEALAAYDDGTGAALHAGGSFPLRAAKWRDSSWSGLGSQPPSGTVFSLAVFDDGAGPELHAGGGFASAGGFQANSLAKWNGASWSPMGEGVQQGVLSGIVHALATFDDGAGEALYIAGPFGLADGAPTTNIARWADDRLVPVTRGLDDEVRALAVFDDGAGEALFVGGAFQDAEGAPVSGVAKWNGSTWADLEGGVHGEIHAFTVFDDGGGAALYAGGDFTLAGGAPASSIAKWDGAAWTRLGGGIAGVVHTMEVFDDGSGAALFVGGDFLVAGGTSAPYLAKWDGTAWTPIAGAVNLPVNALRVFAVDGVEALFVGGSFTNIGGLNARYIGKWNGTYWETLGAGLNNRVYSLEVFDDGNGEALYVGGAFNQAGGHPLLRIGRWDGSTWTPLGDGLGSAFGTDVRAMTVFDDGSGSALHVGGTFTVAGGASAHRIAKWDGATWSSLETGATDAVLALDTFDHGTGDSLYVGGRFLRAFSSPEEPRESFLARWGCRMDAPISYCDPAQANSVALTGAVLTSAGGFGSALATFDITDVPDQPGLLFAGDAAFDQPFGCGRRCVGGTTLRGPVLVPIGNQASGISFDMSPLVAVQIQYWYRDPAHLGACGDTFNLSNALMP